MLFGSIKSTFQAARQQTFQKYRSSMKEMHVMYSVIIKISPGLLLVEAKVLKSSPFP